MKLGICSNFANAVGGSEIVIHHIAKRLIKKYNYEVVVFAFNINKEVVVDEVRYIKCQKSSSFLQQIKDSKIDHLFVYSDSFWEFGTLISAEGQKALEEVRISIALLGMNYMRENKSVYDRFKSIHRKFRVITHSSYYDDYKQCQEDNIPVTVIPNGVDLDEFRENKVKKEEFRDKYGIKSKYILLNVGNWFYGKGQEHLPAICNKLSCPNLGLPEEKKYPRHNDFCLVSISHSIKYPHEKTFLNRFKQQLREQKCHFEYRILRDIPREDVIAAFRAAHVFLFTSLKEVFPLVILEAMATGTPWISMDVGCLREFYGGLDGIHPPGIIIVEKNHDNKGNKVVSQDTIKKYADNISFLLRRDNTWSIMSESGSDLVENRYDWDKIVEQYHNVFI